MDVITYPGAALLDFYGDRAARATSRSDSEGFSRLGYVFSPASQDDAEADRREAPETRAGIVLG
jgi:hypothetical protein